MLHEPHVTPAIPCAPVLPHTIPLLHPLSFIPRHQQDTSPHISVYTRLNEQECEILKQIEFFFLISKICVGNKLPPVTGLTFHFVIDVLPTNVVVRRQIHIATGACRRYCQCRYIETNENPFMHRGFFLSLFPFTPHLVTRSMSVSCKFFEGREFR